MSKKIKRTNQHHRRSPISIAKVLSDVWLDPEWVLVAIHREDARKVLKHLSQLT